VRCSRSSKSSRLYDLGRCPGEVFYVSTLVDSALGQH
jgi:hypothetical protein